MIIGSRQRVAALEGNVTLRLNDAELQQVYSLKSLGVNIDQHLTWDSQVLFRKYYSESNSQHRCFQKRQTCLQQA